MTVFYIIFQSSVSLSAVRCMTSVSEYLQLHLNICLVYCASVCLINNQKEKQNTTTLHHPRVNFPFPNEQESQHIYNTTNLCFFPPKHLSSDHHNVSKYSTVKLYQSCEKMYLNVLSLFIAKLQFSIILRDYLQGFKVSQW